VPEVAKMFYVSNGAQNMAACVGEVNASEMVAPSIPFVQAEIY
jgi:hypothetical protein